MSSIGPQDGDNYGSYRYRFNGEICMGVFTPTGNNDEFEVRDFSYIIAPPPAPPVVVVVPAPRGGRARIQNPEEKKDDEDEDEDEDG
jgi:hypothetical protein